MFVVAGLCACTTTDEIIVDRKGIDEARYEQDLAECRSYSSEVQTGEKAARGAASGAVVGGLVGFKVGAAVGGLVGLGVVGSCVAREGSLMQ